MWRFWLPLVVIVASVELPILHAAGPRLAVISDETAQAAADLAVAELARSERLELVDREQLTLVLKEQKLTASGLTEPDMLRLGQLVKADGVLLFVGREGEGKPPQPTLAARLVAVNPGVILWSLQQPLPLKNAESWQTLIRDRVEATLPKLAVRKEDAIPISVVSVTAAIKRTDHPRIEGELQQLLVHRLTHEPTLFVLERQRLDLLDREKTGLATPLVTDEPFWTGRHLLDVEFSQDLNDATKLSVAATLTRPGQPEPRRLAATGRSDRLAELAESLTKQIVSALDREPSGAAWSAQAEAERFFETAKWHRNYSSWNSSVIWEAVEAAWCLGLRTDEVYSWRVQGLLRKRHRMGKLEVAKSIELMQEAARFALVRPLAQEAYYKFKEGGVVGMFAAESLASAIAQLAGSPITPLRSQELSELRRLTRELHEQIFTHQGWKDGFSGEQRLENVWTWTEHPADTIAVYRRLFAPEAQPNLPIRRYLWRERFGAKVGNWHGTPPEEAQRILTEFLDELCASTDPENKLTGYHTRMKLAEEGEPRQKAQRAYEEALWELRVEFARGRLYLDYLSWLRVHPAQENTEFFLRLFEAFNEDQACQSEPLYRAFLALDQAKPKLEGEQLHRFHTTLRQVVGRRIGSYQGNAFSRALRDMEEAHPEWASDGPEPATRGMIVRRVGWPQLSKGAKDAPQSTFDAEYTTATWFEDRLWIIATIDGKSGVLSVNLATHASEFLPLPEQKEYRQLNLMQLHVAKDVILVAPNHRDAPVRNGLFRYDRATKTWNIVACAYGLHGGLHINRLARAGGNVYSLFTDADSPRPPGTFTLSPNHGVIEIDPAKEQARLIISRHQRQQASPLEDSKLRVYDLRSGPHDEVYVMGGIPVSDALPRSLEALAFSPNDSTWRAIKPSEWQEAERQSPQVSVPSAFGNVVYNWAGGPQYWADDRNSWYGQPTQAILYGDATTGGIVSIPFTLALDPEFGRQHLPNATKLTDNAVARRVRETSQAWLFTPAGVLFWDSKQPFWWLIDADEIRMAAHAQAQAAVTYKFKQPLVLSEANVGRRTQLHATTEDGQQAVWLKSLWNDRQPVVSPDGRRVAFVSERLQNKDIYVIQSDGSGLQNLTDSWADESEPQFSADGKRLTFRSTHRDQSETHSIDLPVEGNAIR